MPRVERRGARRAKTPRYDFSLEAIMWFGAFDHLDVHAWHRCIHNIDLGPGQTLFDIHLACCRSHSILDAFERQLQTQPSNKDSQHALIACMLPSSDPHCC